MLSSKRTGLTDDLSPAGGIKNGVRGWDPWRHLETSGLELMWAWLPHVMAAYVPDHALIILNPEAVSASQRSALAEELGHHELAHFPTPDPTETARMELRARRWAAARLITTESLIEAAKWTTNLSELADELEVDLDLLVERLTQLEVVLSGSSS